MPSDLWEDLADVHPAFKDFAENFARYSGTSKEVFLGQLSVAVKVYGEDVAREASFNEASECLYLAEWHPNLEQEFIADEIRYRVKSHEKAIRQAGEKVSDETPEGARE